MIERRVEPRDVQRGKPGRGGHLCRRRGTLLLACALAALAACQAERDPPGPEPTEAWLELRNESAEAIVEVNLAFTSEAGAGWGTNQLGDNRLGPGQLARLRNIPCPDTYDLRAVSAAGGEAIRNAEPFACGDVVNWEVTGFP